MPEHLDTDAQLLEGKQALGEHLRTERERRGITLDEISVFTRVSKNALQLIEEGKFEVFGVVIARGHVQAYARYLGLDLGQVSQMFEECKSSMRLHIRARDVLQPASTQQWNRAIVLFAAGILICSIGFWGLRAGGLELLGQGVYKAEEAYVAIRGALSEKQRLTPIAEVQGDPAGVRTVEVQEAPAASAPALDEAVGAGEQATDATPTAVVAEETGAGPDASKPDTDLLAGLAEFSALDESVPKETPATAVVSPEPETVSSVSPAVVEAVDTADQDSPSAVSPAEAAPPAATPEAEPATQMAAATEQILEEPQAPPVVSTAPGEQVPARDQALAPLEAGGGTITVATPAPARRDRYGRRHPGHPRTASGEGGGGRCLGARDETDGSGNRDTETRPQYGQRSRRLRAGKPAFVSGGGWYGLARSAADSGKRPRNSGWGRRRGRSGHINAVFARHRGNLASGYYRRRPAEGEDSALRGRGHIRGQG